MDIDRRWGLSLASVMFLTSTFIQCQNQTSNGTFNSNSTSKMDVLVPGSLRIGSGNVFTAPDLFGGEPFSLHTDPVTGQVDFQTQTVDVQKVNEAREREEATKVAELREDIQSRVSSADMPLEARDEEYVDQWGEPIKRGDVEYYDEEEPEAREPIMVPPKGFTQRPPTPTTPKEEESFMSIFESLFGGGEEEKKPEPTRPPPPRPYTVPKRPYPSTVFTTENVRTQPTIRPQETTTERRLITTERQVYQQYPERFNNYQQPPERQPERYNPYQQINRPSVYQQPPRAPERPITRPQPETPAPERQNLYQPNPMPERLGLHQPKPVQEVINKAPYQTTSSRPYQKEPERALEKKNTYQVTEKPEPEIIPVKEVFQVTPERPGVHHTYSERPVIQQTETEKPKERPTAAPAIRLTKPPQKDWQPEEGNHLDKNEKENIDRQDTFPNEIKPTNPHNSPDYFNFINLPVHYSTKDTAIPLISTSYANTKVQGMGASKYEKNNNGKYSNHKYDPGSTTTKRPSYWSSRRPTSRPSTTTKPSFNNPVDFTSLEYDEAAIGSSADFGGYGHKAGVKVETPSTPPRTTSTTAAAPTTTTTIKTTHRPTTTTTTTTTTTQKVTRPTNPPPIRREYDEYEYESYPAQVKPVSSPATTTLHRPTDTVPEETRTNAPKITQKPKETEYEYYDYDTEAPVAPPSSPPPTPPSTTTTTTTTTTTPAPRTTTTPKFKVRYPSLSKDRIKRPEEKVEVVVPTKIETTSQTTTSVQPPSTTIHYFQRPTSSKEPAPVFEEEEEEDEEEEETPQRKPPQEDHPIIVTAGKKENENVNIVLVPAKTTTERVVPVTTVRRPEPTSPPRHPSFDYTTEFTVGVVQGQSPHRPGPSPGLHPPTHPGHYIASSIAASPYEGPDEPFRPIARPAGMTASFQVVGDDEELEKDRSPEPFRPPLPESDNHEPHEFIPSPQFHRPDSNHFLVGSSFNAKPPSKPANPFKTQDYYQPPPAPPKKEILSVKPKPQRPIYTPPNQGATNFFNLGENPAPESPNLVDSNRPYFPQKQEEVYYKPTSKPAFQPPKKEEEDEDYGFFDPKPGSMSSKPQANVELSVDYDFDGIQTEPKPGQYVIFKKPQLNSEINENQLKKPNTPIPHYHEQATTEPARPTESPQPPAQQAEKAEDSEKQESAPNYPRPHWEKNGKPSFFNSQGQRQPLLPPQMSQNLIPPGNIPNRYRKPVSPQNFPPVRKTYNEGNFQTKPKPNLPNILPQFRPNAKIGGPQRPYRPMPPNRRKENFPYRIQNEPDTLMHRDFQVEEEIIPKFITNRVRLPEYDQMMIQKRLGLAQPPPAPRRVQRTPVTTLQMLQQNHGVKKQQVPSTREDQADPSTPLVPPAYKPFKDTKNEPKKEVYVVYPVKTPFNSNIKIEDPDKIDYNFNQTGNQVPLLKPSKRKENKPKPDFPYGFVTPDEKMKGNRKEPQYQPSKSTSDIRPNIQDYQPNGSRPPSSDIRPNIQDYMPSGVKIPNEKQERIDMNLHMQSNNQWNQVSNQEVITRKEDAPAKVNPPTQYHTLMKNTNASEFTLGAVMHTLPDQNRKGQVTSVNLNEENPNLVRPGLNVNERIANGKIVTVSMPLDVNEKEEATGFQAPFQASSVAQTGNQGWNILEHPEGVEVGSENATESSNSTFNIENFTPELIGGFKPIYNTPEPDAEMH